MRIDGKQIAANIYEDLKKRVGELRKKNITPHLAVILIGDDPASVSYVSQKQKWAEFINAKLTILKYPTSITTQELQAKINELNNDPDNQAILIQRPVPPQINIHQIEMTTNPQKDIDGFHPDSPYTFPLALAVIKILKEINIDPSKKSIIVIGKGPTGGKPVIDYLTKLNFNPILIDSKTPNPNEILKSADIIISAVGKPNIITPQNIKKDAILIGVGIARGSDNKLHGDYDEEQIKNIAAFYTPTPGGVGPVNVAMLMHNLIEAASKT